MALILRTAADAELALGKGSPLAEAFKAITDPKGFV